MLTQKVSENVLTELQESQQTQAEISQLNTEDPGDHSYYSRLTTNTAANAKTYNLGRDELESSSVNSKVNATIEFNDSSSGSHTLSTSAQAQSHSSLTQTGISTVRPVKAHLRQGSIAAFIPQNISISAKQKINNELMKMFTTDMQPFSIVDDKGFRCFVKALNPSYDIPTRKTISKSMLPLLYEKCEYGAKFALADAKKVCLTTYSWTSLTADKYLAVTGHFITDRFEMQSILLECYVMNKSPTSQNLAAELKKIVQYWDIEHKVALVVSDNASNIKGAISDVLGWNFFGCLAHKINLVVRKSLTQKVRIDKASESVLQPTLAMTNESVTVQMSVAVGEQREKDTKSPIETLLANIRDIVTFFKRSTNSKEKLIDFQRRNGVEPKTLIQDISTRWNSTYFMLQRFCELEEYVKTTIALLEHDLPVTNQNEWKVAKELCMVLKPFYTATEDISGEHYATASLVIPLCNGLLNTCMKLKKRALSNEVKKVVEILETGFKEKFGSVTSNTTLLTAMLLDPRFKNCFPEDRFKEFAKNEVAKYVTAKIKAETRKNESTSNIEIITDQPSRYSDDQDLNPWEAVDKQVSKSPITSEIARGNIEVRRYLEKPVIERKKDPMEWWKKHGYNYPHLSEVFKERFCCLATSVPCERLFSKSGYVLNERRTRLSPTKVKQILFVNTNIKFI